MCIRDSLIGGHRSKVPRLVEAQQGGDVALETDGIETVSLDGKMCIRDRFMATIGMDNISGTARFTFGSNRLMSCL